MKPAKPTTFGYSLPRLLSFRTYQGVKLHDRVETVFREDERTKLTLHAAYVEVKTATHHYFIPFTNVVYMEINDSDS